MTAKLPQIALDRISHAQPFGNLRAYLRWRLLRLMDSEELRFPIFSAIRVQRVFGRFTLITSAGKLHADFVPCSYTSRARAVDGILDTLTTGTVHTSTLPQRYKSTGSRERRTDRMLAILELHGGWMTRTELGRELGGWTVTKHDLKPLIDIGFVETYGFGVKAVPLANQVTA